MLPIVPRAYCRHRLPISYGWGSGTHDGKVKVTVVCGRCDCSVIVAEEIDGRLVSYDVDWNNAYRASHGSDPFAEATNAIQRKGK